jgi:hypothetical protein
MEDVSTVLRYCTTERLVIRMAFRAARNDIASRIDQYLVY